MRAPCCSHTGDPHRGHEGYRRMLWAVLGINAAMFAVEVVAGLAAGSASLQADALDFLGTRATTPSASLWSEWRSDTARLPPCSREPPWACWAFGC